MASFGGPFVRPNRGVRSTSCSRGIPSSLRGRGIAGSAKALGGDVALASVGARGRLKFAVRLNVAEEVGTSPGGLWTSCWSSMDCLPGEKLDVVDVGGLDRELSLRPSDTLPKSCDETDSVGV